jgi:hypothetical protein
MQIPLNQFEQYIDETILQRGLTYFKKGYVSQPEEITPGLYETNVEGTEIYTVRLKLKGEIISEFSCDCPYDLGPICKHIAAFIFYLQEDKLKLMTPYKDRKPKPSKRKTVAQQVNELLLKLSHEELKGFIREQSDKDPSFRRALLSSFAHLNKNETKSFYTKQIKSILKKAAGRGGFIDWHAVRYVGKAVGELLVTAHKQLNNGNYKSAFLIACAVLEEMTDALQFADDSNADIGSNIDGAYNILHDMATAKLPEEMRKRLFEYTLTAFGSNNFSGWDWHIGMLHIASLILREENEAGQVIALLDQVNKKGSAYEYEKAQTIKFQILKKTKGDKEADKFMEQNLSNTTLRREAIEKALSNNEFDKAITLARDGIAQDSKDKPGLVMEWYDHLLKIAIKQKDTTKIIEYARLIFVDSIKEKQPYYNILKSHVDKKKWASFVKGLVNDLQTKERWFNLEVIATIYINEESWENLLSLLKQELLKDRITLDYIKQYEKYLSNNYPEELVDLYGKGITLLLKHNTGRNYYKNACRYIRRMIKLGGKNRVEELIDQLKKAYPQRRALIDELNNI